LTICGNEFKIIVNKFILVDRHKYNKFVAIFVRFLLTFNISDLVDFGSVQNFIAVEEGTFTIVGTYGYIPPEQFIGRAVPASHLYSLGATLIYLLTGKYPADLPTKGGQIQLDGFTNLSPGFSRWLKKMTEPTLEKRVISARTALDELKRSEAIEPAAIMKKSAVNTRLILTEKSA
jgi:serine/threonine protein kinase